ncbi:MAG: hypothetical protein KDJ37_11345 [Hyphomicrobiaceae bacterium]|nr:hypothetical protein [Hyphomicrobiaceae bacterium]
MKLSRAIMLGVALMAMSTAAAAFQEQQGASGAATAPRAPADAAQATGNLDFSVPGATSSSSGGTEVRIPGLGRLGVLPKMDFGLELLYGAASEPKADVRPDASDDDALRIRGTVKHRF